MSDSTDDRLGQHLRAGAPPLHDPLFRIRVLENRERKLLQRRQRLLLVVALLAVVLPAVVPRLAGLQLAWGAPSLVLGAALITASVLAVRGTRQALRWWRTHRI